MNRVFLFVFCGVLLCLAPLVVHADGSARIKIGISSPLTGGASSYGMDIKNSIEFANDKVAGGKYQLIFEDDRCNGRDAATVAHKLTEIDHVRYVSGFGCSGALLGAAPIYERAQTIVVGVAPSSPKISQAGDYIFRVCPSDKIGAKILFETVASRVKKLGILSEETDFPQNFAQAFSEYNEPKTIEIVSENYLPGTTDFRSVLLKLRGHSVEAILLNTQAEGSLAIIVKQLAEIGWNLPRYAIYWPSAPTFLKAVGSAAEGIIFVDTPGNESILDPQGQRLFQEFTAKYGELNSGDWHFYLSIAAIQVLDQAISSGKDVLTSLNHDRFDTITGQISFDANGDVVGIRHVMKMIRNGKPVLFERFKQ